MGATLVSSRLIGNSGNLTFYIRVQVRVPGTMFEYISVIHSSYAWTITHEWLKDQSWNIISYMTTPFIKTISLTTPTFQTLRTVMGPCILHSSYNWIHLQHRGHCVS